MDIKDFIEKRYESQRFIEFITDSFGSFEVSSSEFSDEELSESEKKNIKGVRYLGSITLSDDKEIGVFEFLSKKQDIENKRVGYNSVLKKFAKEYLLDGAIATFFHPDSDAFRLSFVGIEYDTNKIEVTNLKRYTFLLGKNIPTKTAYMQLKKLKYPTFEELKEVFSVEVVTKEFYKGLEELYFELVNKYLHYPDDDKNKQKEFAIKLIGRVIFIKFLEKKGLIASDIFKIKDSYYFEVLEPLFFEQLNKPNKERFEKFKNDYIPFLNGGLFEPIKDIDFYRFDDKLLERIPSVNILGKVFSIEDVFFEKLFEHFDKFNFTIDENSPDDNELSIDPEMLGRIFENFIAEINPETSQNARKATGSYYTPREIVEYMVNQSILEYLKENTSIDANILKDIIYEKNINLSYQQKSEILSALFKIKVLDPACGSGAFPMGILQKIVRILNQIDTNSNIWFRLQDKKFQEEYDNKDKNYFRKLSIINNSIFGIDIQPIAIEIAKLRFFLSLIVDEEIDDNKENRGIEPLPNLEFKFVCANSLIPLQSNSSLASDEYFEYEKKLKELKNRYFLSYGKEKEEIKKEYLNIRQKLFEEIEKIDLGNALTSKLVNYNPFDPLSVAEFFDSEFMFNVKNGFDIVIGNPPYIDYRKIDNNTKQILKDFVSFKKSKVNKPSIFVFFIERSLKKFLKKKGILTFINPINILIQESSIGIRELLLENQILSIYDLSNQKIFSASTYTMILIVKKDKFNRDIKVIVDKKEYFLSENQIIIDKNKKIIISEYYDIINKININTQSLEKFILHAFVGTSKSGFNKYKIDTKMYKKLSEKEKNNFCSFIESSDIFPYFINYRGFYINKNIYNDKVLSKFNRPSIVIARMTKNIRAIIIKGGFCYGKVNILQDFKISKKYLLSLLNSKLLNFWYKETFNSLHLQGGYLGFELSNILEIPIKETKNTQPFEILVDIIQDLVAKSDVRAKFFEDVVDIMVYELYFEKELKEKDFDIISIVTKDLQTTTNSDELFEKWSDKKHKIKKAIDFIDTVEAVKVIKGLS